LISGTAGRTSLLLSIEGTNKKEGTDKDAHLRATQVAEGYSGGGVLHCLGRRFFPLERTGQRGKCVDHRCPLKLIRYVFWPALHQVFNHLF
jgi:hypothetical protein